MYAFLQETNSFRHISCSSLAVKYGVARNLLPHETNPPHGSENIYFF